MTPCRESGETFYWLWGAFSPSRAAKGFGWALRRAPVRPHASAMPPKRKATPCASVCSSAFVNAHQDGGAGAAMVRNGTSDAWTKLAARVRGHGGVVHKGVHVGNDVDGVRGLVAVCDIAKGTTLFRIPRACAITAAEALSSKLGTDILAQANLIEAQRNSKAAAQENATRETTRAAPEQRNKGQTIPYNPSPLPYSPPLPVPYDPSSSQLPLGDIVLAAFLADDFDSDDANSPWSPYHAILEAESLDDAPAFWSHSERMALLTTGCGLINYYGETGEDRESGYKSHAFKHSKTLAEEIESAFELVVRAPLARARQRAQRLPLPDTVAIHRFKRFLAAVHSRSFHLEGGDTKVPYPVERACEGDKRKQALEREATGGAMVPLLDCANHFRKPRESSWEVTRDDAAGTEFIVVTALKVFKKHEPVRIAYGARSNEELLTKYGFCVEDNSEPDGSSNDVVYFRDPWDLSNRQEDAIPLRIATKPAYTYAPFAKVLDLFRARARKGKETETETEKTAVDETKEDFLGNDFDDDDDDDDDACAALMYGSGDDEDDDAVVNAHELEIEIAALSRMQAYFNTLVELFGKLVKRAESSSSPRAGTCVTYFKSQMRTYEFYASAALGAGYIMKHEDLHPVFLRKQDAARMPAWEAQLKKLIVPTDGVAELVSAYLRVRWTT